MSTSFAGSTKGLSSALGLPLVVAEAKMRAATASLKFGSVAKSGAPRYDRCAPYAALVFALPRWAKGGTPPDREVPVSRGTRRPGGEKRRPPFQSTRG